MWYQWRRLLPLGDVGWFCQKTVLFFRTDGQVVSSRLFSCVSFFEFAKHFFLIRNVRKQCLLKWCQLPTDCTVRTCLFNNSSIPHPTHHAHPPSENRKPELPLVQNSGTASGYSIRSYVVQYFGALKGKWMECTFELILDRTVAQTVALTRRRLTTHSRGNKNQKLDLEASVYIPPRFSPLLDEGFLLALESGSSKSGIRDVIILGCDSLLLVEHDVTPNFQAGCQCHFLGTLLWTRDWLCGHTSRTFSIGSVLRTRVVPIAARSHCLFCILK